MVKVWAVIGERSVGKTATIRALTGVGEAREKWKVAYNSDVHAETYVQTVCPQEKEIGPKDFIGRVAKTNVDYVIVALRYRGAHQQPDAAAYLGAFQRAGWNVAGYAILGSASLSLKLGNEIVIPDKIPANAIAARLRLAWGIK